MAAVLLPYTAGGDVDWAGFESLVARTVESGLVPAVNMDTGYVQLIDATTRTRVLDIAAAHANERGFVAGAFVADEEGAPFERQAYLAAMHDIARRGGTPVLFPSHGLNALEDDLWVDAHETIGGHVDRFIAFELGPMFVPYGRIYPLHSYERLLVIPQCIGAKHSSLSREAEWERLALRDEIRPDFHVFTGNDLAIDMVCYGSDYLLGLASFAPEAFAERDRRWAANEDSFRQLNDVLQDLGTFAFRPPVPAYRHDAAMFLALRGRIATDATPAGAARRPETDRATLAELSERLDASM
jgi:dihydrodipicolinate synthase/N-acetylneuraminate lyase